MGQNRAGRDAQPTQPGETRWPNKRELQRQMQRDRESLAETIGEIKETVEQEYVAAKQTVNGMLDFREQFKEEPLVWSLGALSAGFALGYTVGYAQKHAHQRNGGKHSQVFALADSMVDELSGLGQGLVMPVINLKIKELFGFDFSELLNELGGEKKPRRKSPSRLRAVKPTARKIVRKKKS